MFADILEQWSITFNLVVNGLLEQMCDTFFEIVWHMFDTCLSCCAPLCAGADVWHMFDTVCVTLVWHSVCEQGGYLDCWSRCVTHIWHSVCEHGNNLGVWWSSLYSSRHTEHTVMSLHVVSEAEALDTSAHAILRIPRSDNHSLDTVMGKRNTTLID